jgi:GNAT superfamily N-acetyltransferase
MDYLSEPLTAGHNRPAFSCGKPELDMYLQKQASQDMKKRVSVVFIWTDVAGRIIGYYSLSNESIPRSDTPTETEKIMPPSYGKFPVTLLGRLAVDRQFQGKGYGKMLLVDALRRAADVAKSKMGSIAVIVDPLDDDARGFYSTFGFIDLPTSCRMFMSMKTIEQSLTN